MVGPGNSLHLGWVGTEINGEGVSDWDIYYSVFDGTSWRYPVRVNTDDNWKDLYPEVIVSRDNKAWVLWNRELAFWDNRILGRYYDGNVWGPEVRLDDDTYENDGPAEMALSHADEPWCVWQSLKENWVDGIFFSRYEVQTPVLLSNLRTQGLSDGVQLSWEAVPAAFSAFLIERSAGQRFRLIDSVVGTYSGRYFWEESGLPPGVYRYRIVGRLLSGEDVIAGPVVATVGSIPGDLVIRKLGGLRRGPDLNVLVGMPEPGELTLELFDLQGRLVDTHHSHIGNAGWSEEVWTPQVATGASVPSGVYWIRATLKQRIAVARFVILR
jgi:hypothetical protein